jgi:hypothetical protein
MKFTFEGVEYRIGFQYENRKTGKRKVRNYCTARIETGDERDGTHKIVAQGRVVRFHKDKFVKEEARRYALKEALKDQKGEFIGTAIRAYKNRKNTTAPVAVASAA